MDPDKYGEGHMSDLEIAAYIDHGLPSSRRDEIEDHLARCAACRDNVVQAQALISRSDRSRRFAKGVTLVLAAAGIALVAIPSLRTSSTPDRDAMRAGENDSIMKVYGPIGEVSRPPSRFAWGPLQGALSYHITITTIAGASVWSGSSTDTTIVLPAGVTLVPGQRYLWAVDAVTSEGTSHSTGLREFGIVR
jgi:hypothetical protein